jgi:hypothetical protein
MAGSGDFFPDGGFSSLCWLRIMIHQHLVAPESEVTQ